MRTRADVADLFDRATAARNQAQALRLLRLEDDSREMERRVEREEADFWKARRRTSPITATA